MAAQEPRIVSFSPDTPIKEVEPSSYTFSVGQYIQDASDVLIAARADPLRRPELGKAQDSIILAKKKLGGTSKTPPRTRGLHTIDIHMSPDRRHITAEDFEETGDDDDDEDMLQCTGCAGWPDAPSWGPDAPSWGLPRVPSWARDNSWWKADVVPADAQ